MNIIIIIIIIIIKIIIIIIIISDPYIICDLFFSNFKVFQGTVERRPWMTKMTKCCLLNIECSGSCFTIIFSGHFAKLCKLFFN